MTTCPECNEQVREGDMCGHRYSICGWCCVGVGHNAPLDDIPDQPYRSARELDGLAEAEARTMVYGREAS